MKLSIHKPKPSIIIKCCATKKYNSSGNQKYDAFSIFKKNEIISISNSLKQVLNREFNRVHELYDTHVQFIKSLSMNDDIKNKTICVQDTDSIDLDHDINDDYYKSIIK
jgi:hypothetical protein